MIPNMYQHQIDECIERTKQELRIYRKYHRTEFIEHVENRLKSLERLRKNARVAKIGGHIDDMV